MAATLSFFEFFAGGGMARIGLGAKWRCLFANDFDGQKCAAYRANFGGEELIEADIATLNAHDLPQARADLAWASFPCQDLSLAGERGGLKALRSGAFFVFWRLIEEIGRKARAPRAIVIENVTGLLTSNNGRDFAAVAEALAEAGYSVSAMIIDAQLFTPQSRPRLFIFGFASDALPKTAANTPPDSNETTLFAAYDRLSKPAQDAWLTLNARPRLKRNARLSDIIDWDAEDWFSRAETRRHISMMSAAQSARLDAILKSGARRAGAGFRRTRVEDGKTVQRFEARFDGLAGCLRTPAGGSSRQIVIAINKGKARMRLLSPREAARLMGLPEDYILPAGRTAALKLCGDGVAAPVAQWIGENILQPTLKRDRKAAA